jgi:hypothetical protein
MSGLLRPKASAPTLQQSSLLHSPFSSAFCATLSSERYVCMLSARTCLHSLACISFQGLRTPCMNTLHVPVPVPHKAAGAEALHPVRALASTSAQHRLETLPLHSPTLAHICGLRQSQGLQCGREVLMQGRLEVHALPGQRVSQRKLVRMEGLPADPRPLNAIDLIPHNGVSRMGQMDANLVGPACKRVRVEGFSGVGPACKRVRVGVECGGSWLHSWPAVCRAERPC